MTRLRQRGTQPVRPLLRAVRVIAYELRRGQLALYAASLVYTTLLSFAPLMAVSFSVLRAFGVHSQMTPVLNRLLAPLGAASHEASARLIAIADQLHVGVLGAVGVALLIYTVLALLEKIEQALNAAWRLSEPRPWLRRLSEYLSALLVGPVLVFALLALMSAAFNARAIQALLAWSGLTGVAGALSDLAPYLLAVAGLWIIYLWMPNTRVRSGPAFFGALIAATLWIVIAWVFTIFVVGAGRYAVVYQALATLVLFMLWLYLSWLVLLLGASIAYHQQYPTALAAPTARGMPQEHAMLAALAHIAAQHEAGQAPLRTVALARRLGITADMLMPVLERLEAAGLLSQTTGGIWLLTRAPERIGIDEVLRAADYPSTNVPNLPAELAALLNTLEKQRNDAVRHIDVKMLALALNPGEHHSSGH